MTLLLLFVADSRGDVDSNLETSGSLVLMNLLRIVKKPLGFA